MLWYTHLAFGFLLGLISLSFVNSGNLYLFFGFVLLGALLPDIDKSNSKIGSKLSIFSKLVETLFGHRGIVHTLWGMILFCGVFWFFVSKTYGAAMFVGFFSHLLIDGFTKMGINFLHPIANLHLSGFIETGSASEIFLFVGIIAWAVIMLV